MLFFKKMLKNCIILCNLASYILYIQRDFEKFSTCTMMENLN